MREAGATVILLTGANGLLGSAVLAAVGSLQAQVRAGSRRALSLTQAEAGGRVSYIACDLDQPGEVRAAVAGADIVVHTAYGDEAAMVRQCATLLEAMANDNVQNLVHLSSIAVYGAREGHVFESATPPHPLVGYALAKQCCENLIGQWCRQAPATGTGARRALILRPGIIYGTGSRFWVDKLAERMRRGAWGTFGPGGEGIAALIHVDDAARAVVAACQQLQSEARNSLPPTAAINVVGVETPTWNDYFTALARAGGVEALPVISQRQLALRLPVSRAAKLWRRAGLPGGGAAALAPTQSELDLFRTKARYATDAAQSVLGFTARIGLSEGLARTRMSMLS